LDKTTTQINGVSRYGRVKPNRKEREVNVERSKRGPKTGKAEPSQVDKKSFDQETIAA